MMSLRTLFRCFPFLLVLLFAANAQAQHAPVKKIRGIVFDSTANVQIPNATITFTAHDGNGAEVKTKTITAAKDGRFKVRLDRSYSWDMTVSAPGYESYTWKQVNGKKEFRKVLLVVKLTKKKSWT